MTMGIYQIRNIINEHIYIGSSHNIEERFKRHKRDLYNQTHHSIYLQRAYNKYGINNFVYEIIEEVYIEKDLLDREQYYIDKLNPQYNVSTKATNCVLCGVQNGMYGKQSAFKGKSHTESAKQRIAQGHVGITRSIESRQKQSESLKQYYSSHDSKLKGRKTKPMSKEDKLKRSKPIEQYTTDDEFVRKWESAKQVEDSLGISASSIGKCCRNTPHFNTAGGYKWKYENHRND